MSKRPGYARDAHGNISASRRKKKSGNGFIIFLLSFALTLLLIAGGMYAYDFYESKQAEKNAAEALDLLYEAMEDGRDAEEYLGIIEIPAIDVTLPVFKTCDEEYLKTAPCLYRGNVDGDKAIIAGHDYKAHFSKLSELGEGDEVTIKTLNGKIYVYHVTDQTLVDGKDFDGMFSGNWDLTLFTCNSTGAKRITIRCEKEKDLWWSQKS